MQVGLGEGLAPSSATNVMARQVPECGPCRCCARLSHQACIICMAVKVDSHEPGNTRSSSAVSYALLPSVTLLQHLLWKVGIMHQCCSLPECLTAAPVE